MATSTYSVSAVTLWKVSRPGRVASDPAGRSSCPLVNKVLATSDLTFFEYVRDCICTRACNWIHSNHEICSVAHLHVIWRL